MTQLHHSSHPKDTNTKIVVDMIVNLHELANVINGVLDGKKQRELTLLDATLIRNVASHYESFLAVKTSIELKTAVLKGGE